jgi:hypothetical protein
MSTVEAKESDKEAVNEAINPASQSNRWYWLAPVFMVMFVSWYFVARYQGYWAEYDTCSFANMIRVFRDAAVLVPQTGERYDAGFGYQAISTFVVTISGMEVSTLQQIVYPLTVPLVVFPAWALYREFTGSDRGAALATILLFTQPEFLFVILRSSHEKMTRSFILLGLLLLARSLRLRHHPRLFASHVALLYLPVLAMITCNVAISLSFLIAVGIAISGGFSQKYMGWVRDFIVRKGGRLFKWIPKERSSYQFLDPHVLHSLLYTILICFGLFYTFVLYIYPMSIRSLGILQRVVSPPPTTQEGGMSEEEQELEEQLHNAKIGVTALMHQVDDPKYDDIREDGTKLLKNIEETQEEGDSLQLMAERAIIVGRLTQKLDKAGIEWDTSTMRQIAGEEVPETEEEDSENEAPSYEDYIRIDWRHPIFFALLGLGNWVMLLASGAIWAWQGFVWLWKGDDQSKTSSEWLSWLVYAAYAAQIPLAVFADSGGAPGGNALQRILPSISMFSVAIVGGFLANWRPPFFPRLIWGFLSVFIACIAALSIFKATNEPVFRNKWTFYRPEEMAAMVWSDAHLDNAQVWTEFDERLWAAFRLKVGRSVQEGVDDDFVPFPISYRLKQNMRDLLISDVTRLRSSRRDVELPLPPDAFRVYDNGGAQIYHLRPKTPHQR